MAHRFSSAVLSLLVLTGCTSGTPHEVVRSESESETVDADDLLDRFETYVASHGLVDGERIHATATEDTVAVDGTQLRSLDEQDCPVTPPSSSFIVRDIVIAPGRLACTWKAGRDELTLSVLLDADLRPIETGSPNTPSGGLNASRGAVHVADDRQQVWVQDTGASRMMRARFTPHSDPGEGATSVSPDLAGWIARLARRMAD